MRRRTFTVMAGVICGAVGVLAHDLGPEWTKVGMEYVRNIEVKARRYQSGNVTGYSIKMENDQASLYEIDDNQGFGFRSHPYGEFEVRKQKDGTAASFKVQLGGIWYQDLNADGFLDTMTDSRELIGSKSFIFFQGRYVPVSAGKGGIGDSVESEDRKTVYQFKHGSWLIDEERSKVQLAVAAIGANKLPVEKIETRWVSAGSAPRIRLLGGSTANARRT